MEQSRRAVESYWRSRMVDAATSDEDKVTPVYKLEEICDLLRSSHSSIVKEVAEFIIKRLDHKSPIVKQKALRMIKYAIGKSGAEFRREMQRNSIAIRQLVHYRGQPDPLKGDAPNKAVRETAQEALSALFSTEESNDAAPRESSLGSRIQGFGNTNYEMPSEDKRSSSFINEVVNIGNATIKHGLSSLTQSSSIRKNNDTGIYRSPNLRRSLTREDDYYDQHEGINSHETRFSKTAGSGKWGQDISASQAETSHGESASAYGHKTREEKLLETIVSSGGVRLQPTRDAIHVFLVEASKLNASSMAHAIETKLKSPMWQVRMKAVCVLEALLRKKDDGNFSVISSYFIDNLDMVVQCSESPQASLREKANKVLSLLGQQNGGVSSVDKSAVVPQPAIIPDLMDTGDSNDFLGIDDSNKGMSEPKTTDTANTSASLIHDLLGDNSGSDDGTKRQNLDDDPFADVSFHTTQVKDHAGDFFSVESHNNAKTSGTASNHRSQSEPLDLLNSSFDSANDKGTSRNDINSLMGSLSINGNDPFAEKDGSTAQKGPEPVNLVSGVRSDDKKNPINVLNYEFSSQASETNVNPVFSLGAMTYSFPPGMAFNHPSLASHQMNYTAMGSLLAQQQFLAAMSNFQQLGNIQSNMGNNNAAGSISSPYPDVFNSSMAAQPPTSLKNDTKREDSRAFDFISDHLAAARDLKRAN